MNNINFYRTKMELPAKTGKTVYFYNDLVFAEYENLFFKFYFDDGTYSRVEITVKELLKHLPEKEFFLCNRTAIINICRYKSYDMRKCEILMDNGKNVHLSSRKMKAFSKNREKLHDISHPCTNRHICTNENCPDRLRFCSPVITDDFSL